MAALQDIQRILCPEMLIKRTCLRIRDICVRGICIPVRAFCLPAISLTRTPGGRHMEWAAAFFDPCFERLEKGVYYVGLVSVSQRLSFQKRVNFSQERVNFNTHTHTRTQVCFFLVLIGITTVVGTFYTHLIPYLWSVQHPLVFSLYVLYGHYLLINVCFHYFKGVYTDPGSAPKVCANTSIVYCI